MTEEYENMTMADYLTKKAQTVEKAIISHCDDICDLLISQFEEAKNKELGELENDSSASKVKVIVKLTCIVGPYKDHVFTIKPKSKVYPIIGRSERDDIISNGVCLSRDLEVSSFHGKFFLRGGQLKYRDMNSTNHSYVNGELVEDDITLKTGDVLHVGQSELKISIQKV
ncbi:forkhead-associated protein [Blastocystis sp. ATCC 50177/Nand II]|uniref:Forkhead-associated protein n=1 Tax=Blastocystis sp. subtype 1 (strain ATCC 50177 / NandII) TaxID=478820 RepID=A0A196SJF7_BLAHN|nr:forkhead-associated protein [Blastocystis sp. ATCC 50177/Nand II]